MNVSFMKILLVYIIISIGYAFGSFSDFIKTTTNNVVNTVTNNGYNICNIVNTGTSTLTNTINATATTITTTGTSIID